MIVVKGKYNEAIVYSKNIEHGAKEQIRQLCNQKFVKGSEIRVMPDVHKGLGCTIGATMTIEDKIVPNLVGVDIGCGIETIKLSETSIDLKKLDEIIYRWIPAGFNIRKTIHEYVADTRIDSLKAIKYVDINRAKLSVGTLGGGNHFIEVNKDDEGNLYLNVHSGSRHLGHQIAEHYQGLAYRKLKDKYPKMDRQLAYLEGKDFDDYLWDMAIVQEYAIYNRRAIIHEIISRMELTIDYQFTTVHNYIDIDRMILRKGAVSAEKGQMILIPINMRDGSLICVGKGNPEWNYSAPHGAGRVMSRREAKRRISLREFKETMKGIYTTSVNRSTVDECALAYKPMEEITENIGDTAEIKKAIKPIYNFKA